MPNELESPNREKSRLHVIHILVFDAVICAVILVMMYRAGYAWYLMWLGGCFGAAMITAVCTVIFVTLESAFAEVGSKLKTTKTGSYLSSIPQEISR